jgi:chromosome segregation ATPase
MRRLCAFAMIIVLSSLWAQSLGDVARATSNRPKASKVITNDDLATPDRTDSLQQELDRMRFVLREICADPKTERGRKLSNYDKRSIDEAVKPLRERVNAYERLRNDYKERLDALDKEMEEDSRKKWPKDRPFTEGDIQRRNAMAQDYRSRRAALAAQGENEFAGYREFQLQLESVGNECPEAAKTIPD